MYKMLICWRYLRTRYIALVSIISVMLGVATMLVVNSVMAGFRQEMYVRLKGVHSDVIVESHSFDGFPDPEVHMRHIRETLGDRVAGMSATVHTPAMLAMKIGDTWVPRPAHLVGIDEHTYHNVGDFSNYLQHPANRKALSFQLREAGFDTFDHQAGDRGRERKQLRNAGWRYRRHRAEMERVWNRLPESSPEENPVPEARSNAASGAAGPAPEGLAAAGPRVAGPEVATPEQAANATTGSGTDTASLDHANADAAESGTDDLEEATPSGDAGAPEDEEPGTGLHNPFAQATGEEGHTFDAAVDQHPGAVVGMGLVSFRDQDGNDRFAVVPGDDVQLTFPSVGETPRAISTTFTVVDLYESKMSEYDSSLVFVSLKTLQDLRGMYDRESGTRYVTSIMVKLKDPEDCNQARDTLRALFPGQWFSVDTWRDKQGPLLAAVQMETAILNVLLFLIIAVAGFGILAIFYMIVVEKTRDIGILKSLGASSRGVMGIFVGYGLSLGVVGAGVGCVLGLLFVANINGIADLLGKITGVPVFDPEIYYFYEIPTIVEPFTVAWVVGGAILIAVLASVLPARRAARLHPVAALRFE